MATNRALRTALLTKRKFSPQRLSQLVGNLQKQLPMSTELATYVLAHQSGITISRYLTSEQVADVRNLVAQIKGTSPATSRAVPQKSTARRTTYVSIASLKVEKLPGLSPAHAREAKDMAEKVFPAMYVFENTLRDLIERVLLAAHGSGWWMLVPKPVRDRAAKHKADEATDPWHSKRGNRELEYILLSDLKTIIITPTLWPLFSPYFPRQSWIEALIDDLNVSRRVLAHMSPLADNDIANIEAAFRKWVDQLRAIEPRLP